MSSIARLVFAATGVLFFGISLIRELISPSGEFSTHRQGTALYLVGLVVAIFYSFFSLKYHRAIRHQYRIHERAAGPTVPDHQEET